MAIFTHRKYLDTKPASKRAQQGADGLDTARLLAAVQESEWAAWLPLKKMQRNNHSSRLSSSSRCCGLNDCRATSSGSTASRGLRRGERAREPGPVGACEP